LILLFMIVHFTCVLYFNSQLTSLNYLIEFVSQKSTVTWSANFTLGEIATARSASGQAWPTKRPSNWSWGKRGNFSQPINERGTPKARLDSKRRSKKNHFERKFNVIVPTVPSCNCKLWFFIFFPCKLNIELVSFQFKVVIVYLFKDIKWCIASWLLETNKKFIFFLSIKLIPMTDHSPKKPTKFVFNRWLNIEHVM
jgi:hypothetical protein